MKLSIESFARDSLQSQLSISTPRRLKQDRLPPAYVRDILKYIKCFVGSKIIASKCHSKRVFQPPRVTISAMNTKWSYTLSVLCERFYGRPFSAAFPLLSRSYVSKELQIVTGVKFLTSWPCASYTNLQGLRNNT